MKLANSRRGVALLLVLVSLAFVSVISIEIIFSSRVDIRISRNARDRLQAYYLGVSAVKLGMLRVQIFKELQNQVLSKKIPAGIVSEDMVNMVWSFQMPNFPLSQKTSSWPGSMYLRIASEGSKIPINLLDGNVHRYSSKEKADTVRKQIEVLIDSTKKDEEFEEVYPDLVSADLIDPLVDRVDEDSSKQSGGDESSDYDSSESSYSPRNDRIPTLSELVMIYNWNDDLVARLGPHFSVLNLSTEVNANYIPLERIKAMQPSLTREELMVIEKRRREQPFKSLQDLQDFVRSSPDIRNGQDFDIGDLKDSKLETAFIIEGVGQVGESRRTLKVGVRIDTKTVKSGSGDSQTQTTTLEKPRVVFAEEEL
jgi:type II secretory pathway component PulK